MYSYLRGGGGGGGGVISTKWPRYRATDYWASVCVESHSRETAKLKENFANHETDNFKKFSRKHENENFRSHPSCS